MDATERGSSGGCPGPSIPASNPGGNETRARGPPVASQARVSAIAGP